MACGGEQYSTDGLADGLQKHVAEDDPCAERQSDELPAQGLCADGYHFGIVFTEPRYDFGRIDVAYDGTQGEEDDAHLDAVPKAFAHTRVNTRTVIVAAYGLESLPEANEEGVDEHADASHDGHACNGCIAIPSCGYVEQDSGEACQSLSAKRGASSVKDFAEIGEARSEVARADADVLSPAVHIEQDEEAAHLSAKRCPSGSGNAHIEYENQQRSQSDIEYCSRGDAYHRIECVPLKAHLVV